MARAEAEGAGATCAGAERAGAGGAGAGAAETAGAGVVGAEAAGAGLAGAGDEDGAEEGAATAALGFGTAGFVAGFTACGGDAAPLPAGVARKSNRFAAKTVNASTPIKNMSASTWFLVLIQLSERCVVYERDAIACLAP